MDGTARAAAGDAARDGREALLRGYDAVRLRTERICAPLAVEDYGVQPATEASPPKWHLAHTSWFFETFLLRESLPGYRPFEPLFEYLFNSYYDTVGPYWPRPRRGLLSRPTVDEVYRYRTHVDGAMAQLLSESDAAALPELARLLALGLNHEQQHQELLLTDIKLNFGHNPLRPVYQAPGPYTPLGAALPLRFLEYAGGEKTIGHDGAGFAYDNETPRHRVWVDDFRLANRPVTNGEFLEFIDAGGYERPEWWLADGWAAVRRQRWSAPLYWEQDAGGWWQMTLSGMRPVDTDAPVAHVSFFEADAYARFAGARLPTEEEWEHAAAPEPVDGNFFESGLLAPEAATAGEGLRQLFGDVWEWTGSPYRPYPGYRALSGALGEYNGKFMCNQMVLRGGSCATPRDHLRVTYRNFFYPAERWQFCGVRLAMDA